MMSDLRPRFSAADAVQQCLSFMSQRSVDAAAESTVAVTSTNRQEDDCKQMQQTEDMLTDMSSSEDLVTADDGASDTANVDGSCTDEMREGAESQAMTDCMANKRRKQSKPIRIAGQTSPNLHQSEDGTHLGPAPPIGMEGLFRMAMSNFGNNQPPRPSSGQSDQPPPGGDLATAVAFQSLIEGLSTGQWPRPGNESQHQHQQPQKSKGVKVKKHSSTSSHSPPPLDRSPGETLAGSIPRAIFNPDAYCELCNKEFCNKYFLRTHKANKHGIYTSESGTPGSRLPTQGYDEEGNGEGGMSQHHLSDLVTENKRKTPIEMNILPRPPTIGGDGMNGSHQLAKDIQRLLAGNSILGHHGGVCSAAAADDDADDDTFEATNESPSNCSNIVKSVMMDGQPGTACKFPPNNSPAIGKYVESSNLNSAVASQHINFLTSRPIPPDSLAKKQASPLTLLSSPADMTRKEGSSASALVSPEKLVVNPEGLHRNGSALPIRGPELPLLPPTDPSQIMNGSSQPVMVNLDAFCALCQKEFCNKYFLRIHKLKKHGVCSPDLPPEKVRKILQQMAKEANKLSGEAPSAPLSSASTRDMAPPNTPSLNESLDHMNNNADKSSDSFSTSAAHPDDRSASSETASGAAEDGPGDEDKTKVVGSLTSDTVEETEEFRKLQFMILEMNGGDHNDEAAVTNARQMALEAINNINRDLKVLSTTSQMGESSATVEPPEIRDRARDSTRDERFTCHACPSQFASRSEMEQHVATGHHHPSSSTPITSAIDSVTATGTVTATPASTSTPSSDGAAVSAIDLQQIDRVIVKENNKTTIDPEYASELAQKYLDRMKQCSNSTTSGNQAAQQQHKPSNHVVGSTAGVAGSKELDMSMSPRSENENGMLNNQLPLLTDQLKYRINEQRINGFNATEQGKSLLDPASRSKPASLCRSYCQICKKELCNKYFMKTHMLKMHGIDVEAAGSLLPQFSPLTHNRLGTIENVAQNFVKQESETTGVVGGGQSVFGNVSQQMFDMQDPTKAAAAASALAAIRSCPLCHKEMSDETMLMVHVNSEHGIPPDVLLTSLAKVAGLENGCPPENDRTDDEELTIDQSEPDEHRLMSHESDEDGGKPIDFSARTDPPDEEDAVRRADEESEETFLPSSFIETVYGAEHQADEGIIKTPKVTSTNAVETHMDAELDGHQKLNQLMSTLLPGLKTNVDANQIISLLSSANKNHMNAVKIATPRRDGRFRRKWRLSSVKTLSACRRRIQLLQRDRSRRSTRTRRRAAYARQLMDLFHLPTVRATTVDCSDFDEPSSTASTTGVEARSRSGSSSSVDCSSSLDDSIVGNSASKPGKRHIMQPFLINTPRKKMISQSQLSSPASKLSSSSQPTSPESDGSEKYGSAVADDSVRQLDMQIFLPSLVYLPVQRRISQPLTVAFDLTPA